MAKNLIDLTIGASSGDLASMEEMVSANMFECSNHIEGSEGNLEAFGEDGSIFIVL